MLKVSPESPADEISLGGLSASCGNLQDPLLWVSHLHLWCCRGVYVCLHLCR